MREGVSADVLCRASGLEEAGRRHFTTKWPHNICTDTGSGSAGIVLINNSADGWTMTRLFRSVASSGETIFTVTLRDAGGKLIGGYSSGVAAVLENPNLAPSHKVLKQIAAAVPLPAGRLWGQFSAGRLIRAVMVTVPNDKPPTIVSQAVEGVDPFDFDGWPDPSGLWELIGSKLLAPVQAKDLLEWRPKK